MLRPYRLFASLVVFAMLGGCIAEGRRAAVNPLNSPDVVSLKDTADTVVERVEDAVTDTSSGPDADTFRGPLDCERAADCQPAADPCRVAVCDDGACIEVLADAGTLCGDGGASGSCVDNTWLAPARCAADGACVAGGAIDCDVADACVDGTCDPLLGCGTEPTPADTPCLAGALSAGCDGLSWHRPDRCDGAGTCADGGAELCDGDGVCLGGSCDDVEGCGRVPLLAGRACNNGGPSGVCSGSTYFAPDLCDAAGHCVDGLAATCGTTDPCRISVCHAGTGCATEPGHEGEACLGDGLSEICVEDTWHPLDHCAGGHCVDGGVSNCPAEPCLDRCWDGIDLMAIGCSDGSREGFVNETVYPNIASCGGAWTIPGVFKAGPACGRAAGNDGLNANGTGCNVQDLCSEGWKVCDDLPTIATATNGNGCAAAVASDYPNFGAGPRGYDPTGVSIPASPGGAFFVAAVTGPGAGDCLNGSVIHDDAFGCGNLGRGTKNSCAPLNRTSSNYCYGLQDYTWPGSADRDNPATDFGYTTTASWAWSCADESVGEPDTLVKKAPDRQGGVLCCRVAHP